MQYLQYHERLKVNYVIKFVFFKVWLFTIGLLLISSCGKVDSAIDETYFALEKPFGFTWEVTDKYESDANNDCNQLIDSLSGLLNSSQKEKAILECISEEYSTVYVAANAAPPAFRKGEISVGLLGGNHPTQYTYSFLHDWRPDDFAKKSRQRKEHAAEIKSQLVKLYGPPNTNGHFDQGTQFGYVADDEIYQPCSFWLIHDIAILLCSERVIMVDGIEMSLSFMNLSEEVIDEQIRNMALVASGGKPMFSDEESERVIHSSYSKAVLKKMSKLVYSDDFNRCDKSSLEPIQDIWAKSQNTNAKLQHIYRRYSGDDLAEYVFENAKDIEDSMPDVKQDLAVLLMLKRAADQGSATAMNEIGASLLHCYQGVEQNVVAAKEWLNKAAAAGDAMAMQTLASMHLANLIESESSKSSALTLLEECSKINPEVCEENLATLNLFLNFTDK